MKTRTKNWLSFTILITTSLMGVQSAKAQSLAEQDLIARFDLNGNGKIDADEHKAYARERARLVRAKAIEEARKRPPAKPGERIAVPPARWTPEMVRKYDANLNGRIDPGEREKERTDRVKAAIEAAKAKPSR